MNGSFSSMERSVGISEHLKIVEVKCEVIDERVLKVLQFLCKFSIRKLTYISPCASIFLTLFKNAFVKNKVKSVIWKIKLWVLRPYLIMDILLDAQCCGWIYLNWIGLHRSWVNLLNSINSDFSMWISSRWK